MVFYAYASSGPFAIWLITAKDKGILDAWFRAMEIAQFGNIIRVDAEWYRYANFAIEHSTTDYHLAQKFHNVILFKPMHGYNDSWHIFNNGPFVDCIQHNWYYIRSKRYKALYWDVQRKTEAEALQVYASTKSRARFQAIKGANYPNYAPCPPDNLIIGSDMVCLRHASGPVSFIKDRNGFTMLTIARHRHFFTVYELGNAFAPQSDDRIAYIPNCGSEWELVY